MSNVRARSSWEDYSEYSSATEVCSTSAANDIRLGLASYYADDWLDDYDYIEFVQRLQAVSWGNVHMANNVAELWQIRFYAPMQNDG